MVMLAKKFAAVAFAFSISTPALAQRVDWKMYGGVEVDGQLNECFYDAEGVVRSPDRRIKVWTKCLSQKDLEGIDDKILNAKIADIAARKLIDTYIPPIAKVQEFTSDQAITIIAHEVAAGISHIQSKSRILYELNCTERMLRELSISLTTMDKTGFKDSPSNWKHITPESNANSLVLILCQPPG